MCYSVGDKVRLVANTLFVAKGAEGTVVEPMKGQTPPQLFPNRVSFPIGQDTRTVWCGTDEIELIDDGGPTADNTVADGSRDYCPEGGPEDRDPADTAQAGPPPCPCITGGLCEALISEDEPWSDDWAYEPGEWPSDFECDVSRIFTDAEALLVKKHQDYGPKNISQSPGGALNGLRVRMHDKLARINNLLDSGATPTNESLGDSFIDLLNYAAIGIMVLEGTWPNE